MKRFYIKQMVFALLLTLIISASSFAGDATKWNVSKSHSSVNFKIWHLMTPVHGKFEDFDIDLNFDPENLEGSSITVSIQVASINTGWEPRDEHLRMKDWFDATIHPVMSFKSSEITGAGEGNYIAKGTLKMKGIEKEIDLPFKLLGVKEIPESMKETLGDIDEVASFEIANFSVNRKDFKVGTGTSTKETAAIVYSDVVGSEVNINIAIEANRKTK